MFLGLIGVALASAYGLKAVASDTKTYMLENNLNNRGPIDFDRDFEFICMICRIKRIEYPSLTGGELTEVLPEKGADKAYEFLMENPTLDIEDFNHFCEIYNRIREQELIKRQNTWNEEYKEIVSSLKLTNEVTTFKKRVIGIPISHDELIDKVYYETILGQIALKKGRAVFQDRRSGKLHTWALMNVSSGEAEKLYKACCRKVGVDVY